MREYGKISPRFWTGKTGKALRKYPEAQILALYLISCPSSSMIGVFTCPLMYMAYETGLGEEGASKALRRLIEEGFCTYDWDSETIFVHEMARYQIADALKANDKQVKAICKAYENIQPYSIKSLFFERYKEAFHLPDKSPFEAPSKPLPSPFNDSSNGIQSTIQKQEPEADQNLNEEEDRLSPFEAPSKPLFSEESNKIKDEKFASFSEAPSKPLRSQEQEQEQEQLTIFNNSSSKKRVGRKKNENSENPEKALLGSRLSRDWVPSEQEIEFCKTERPDLQSDLVAARFRDYWVAQPGVKGRKTDWPATWRNWVRNEKQQARTRPTFPYESTRDKSRRETNEALTGKSQDCKNPIVIIDI